MSAHAWHFRLKDGPQGTIVGEHMPERKDILAELKYRYQGRADGAEVRRAGEKEEGAE